MRITRACDYAFRAMIFLAGAGGAPVGTAQIAGAVDAPRLYLRKILQSLSRAGLVRTSAGSGGGVVLLAAPEEITLKDIIEAVEGPISLSDCVEHPDVCPRSPTCKVHTRLVEIETHLKEEFASSRLADLM